MMSKNYTHIIWDWNGTLLDDVGWCITVINNMLIKRGLDTLDTVEAYQRVFGFPIADYYRRAGFDFSKESFERLAAEYIELYHGKNAVFQLFPHAILTLERLRERGLRQVILSASELGNLLSQIRLFDIEHYFDEVAGISDIYANSKVGIGKAYMERSNAKNALLIGDTIHDKEVADMLGVKCLLVANGHQSKEVLLSQGVPVVEDLLDILEAVG